MDRAVWTGSCPAQLSALEELLQGSKLQDWPQDPNTTPTRSCMCFSKSRRHLPGHRPVPAAPAESLSLQLFCFIFLAALVSFWFCLSKSGLKENKTNESTQELIYLPPSEAKKWRHKLFILSSPYHNLHFKIFKIHVKSCLCSVTPAYALHPPLAVNTCTSHSHLCSPRSYSHLPSV